MAICGTCDQEMTTSVGCTDPEYIIGEGNRIPNASRTAATGNDPAMTVPSPRGPCIILAATRNAARGILSSSRSVAAVTEYRSRILSGRTDR